MLTRISALLKSAPIERRTTVKAAMATVITAGGFKTTYRYLQLSGITGIIAIKCTR